MLSPFEQESLEHPKPGPCDDARGFLRPKTGDGEHDFALELLKLLRCPVRSEVMDEQDQCAREGVEADFDTTMMSWTLPRS